MSLFKSVLKERRRKKRKKSLMSHRRKRNIPEMARTQHLGWSALWVCLITRCNLETS
jgi:hypothetical protein